jgi:peptidylprolyl isomerase
MLLLLNIVNSKLHLALLVKFAIVINYKIRNKQVMRKNIFNFLFLSLLFTGLLTSCDEASEYDGFKETEDGLFYKFHIESGDTQSVNLNDIVKVHLNYRTKDSSFNKSAINQPVDIKIMEPTYPGDVYDALKLMHIGDSATFILGASEFFELTVGAGLPEFLDSNDIFYLDVKMDSITSSIEMARKENERRAKFQEAEPKKINTYLAENNMDETPNKDGIYIKHIKKGKGAKIENGKHAKVHFKVKVVGDEWFEDTKMRNEPYTHLVGTGRFSEGFDKALLNMRVGGEALVLIPSNLAFGPEGVDQVIPPYSPIAFEIEVLKVLSEEEYQQMIQEQEAEQMKMREEAAQKEVAEIENYCRINEISIQPRESGLYFIPVVEGSGKTAKSGDKVKVHYDGYLLDGTKFDSSRERGETFEFTLGQGEVIQGWDLGINGMKEGGKAKLIIPSYLGYGPNGSGPIPPNSPLIFDVELIEVVE